MKTIENDSISDSCYHKPDSNVTIYTNCSRYAVDNRFVQC